MLAEHERSIPVSGTILALHTSSDRSTDEDALIYMLPVPNAVRLHQLSPGTALSTTLCAFRGGPRIVRSSLAIRRAIRTRRASWLFPSRERRYYSAGSNRDSRIFRSPRFAPEFSVATAAVPPGASGSIEPLWFFSFPTSELRFFHLQGLNQRPEVQLGAADSRRHAGDRTRQRLSLPHQLGSQVDHRSPTGNDAAVLSSPLHRVTPITERDRVWSDLQRRLE